MELGGLAALARPAIGNASDMERMHEPRDVDLSQWKRITPAPPFGDAPNGDAASGNRFCKAS